MVLSGSPIWFTDPSYGIDSDYEGDKADAELPCQVYRIDPTGRITVVADDFVMPNGLAFSPDEKYLYIADSGRTQNPTPIRRFELDNDGSSLERGEIFAECTAGVFDGFRCDTNGRIWTSAADGVHCYNPSGNLIGKLRIPELVANVTFGGPKRNRLFICGTTSIYSVYLKVNGCTPG